MAEPASCYGCRERYSPPLVRRFTFSAGGRVVSAALCLECARLRFVQGVVGPDGRRDAVRAIADLQLAALGTLAAPTPADLRVQALERARIAAADWRTGFLRMVRDDGAAGSGEAA